MYKDPFHSNQLQGSIYLYVFLTLRSTSGAILELSMTTWLVMRHSQLIFTLEEIWSECMAPTIGAGDKVYAFKIGAVRLSPPS